MNQKKMRVAWICANASYELKSHLKEKVQASGGWIDALLSEIKKRKEIQLFYFFYSSSLKVNGLLLNDVEYYSFSSADEQSIEMLKTMDVIHAYGTENIMVDALLHSVDAENVIVSLQGLKSEIAEDYLNGLESCMKKLPFLIRKGIMAVQMVHQRNYRKDGEAEKDILRRVTHVIGRTHWDKACAVKINPKVKYHVCQELLREVFYCEPKWSYSDCKKHSVYIAQGNYTVKGIHMILKSMAVMKKKYPDLKVRISGDDILNNQLLLTRLGLNYAGLIQRLINLYDLADCIEYIGVLSAEQVKQELLNCHVFLLPSLIENSPNSVGEALLTGVPVVASNVGGVSSLCKENLAFRLYPYDDGRMLEKHLEELFEWDEKVECDVKMNLHHAQQQYHREHVGTDLTEIYRCVKGEKYENQ